MGSGGFRGGNHIGIGRIGATKADVFARTGRKDNGVLGNQRHMATEISAGQITKVRAVQSDLPR